MSENTKTRGNLNKYRHVMIKYFALELLVCSCPTERVRKSDLLDIDEILSLIDVKRRHVLSNHLDINLQKTQKQNVKYADIIKWSKCPLSYLYLFWKV